jgi:AraC-like DNA-binding protein
VDRPPAHAELLALVAAHATAEGRTLSPHPGLAFLRRDRPGPKHRAQATTLALAVVVQGRKVAHFGDRTLTYDPLNYLVLTGEADFDAAITEASPERPYLSLSIAVPPELVAKTLLSLADVDLDVGAGAVDEPAFVARLDPPILDALCRLVRAAADPLERAVLAPLVLEEIVFRLLRSDAAAVLRRSVRGGDEARIQEAMAFIRAHACDRLNVDDLARRFAMSPSHFAHRFRAVARVSPMRYVKHVRLDAARHLLLHGARAGEVADRVGYASASHFTRDFKGCYGVPPAEYARRLRDASAGSGKTSAAPGVARLGPPA